MASPPLPAIASTTATLSPLFLPSPRLKSLNSWYMIHNHLVNYTWEAGYCASDDVEDIIRWFIAHGLPALGYRRANFDDCVVVGRDAAGDLIPDPAAFPYGVLNVSRRYAALGFSTGFYTVRGDTTCASGPPPRIERPGSAGHEAQDARWWVSQGIDYIKSDTCGAPQVPYTVMRDALNATGAPVFLSMCEPGEGPATAPFGRAWGNGWRTDIDDGGLWRPILQNVNTNAALYNFSGCDEQHHDDGLGCGFNDMGLLMVGGGMSAAQDRSHMALWAIMMSKLLISVDVRKMDAASVALISNAELIAIDQDAAKLQGQRVIPPLNASRARADVARIAAWKAAHLAGGSWKAAGRAAELLRADAPDAGAVPGTEDDDVLRDGGRVEVWQRQLDGGDWALLLFNNGIAAGAPVACTGACWARMGWAPGARVAVRDVLARTDNGTAADGFTATVAVNDTVLLRLAAA